MERFVDLDIIVVRKISNFKNFEKTFVRNVKCPKFFVSLYLAKVNKLQLNIQEACVVCLLRRGGKGAWGRADQIWNLKFEMQPLLDQHVVRSMYLQ